MSKIPKDAGVPDKLGEGLDLSDQGNGPVCNYSTLGVPAQEETFGLGSLRFTLPYQPLSISLVTGGLSIGLVVITQFLWMIGLFPVHAQFTAYLSLVLSTSLEVVALGGIFLTFFKKSRIDFVVLAISMIFNSIVTTIIILIWLYINKII